MPITQDPARLAAVANEIGAAAQELEAGNTRVRLPVLRRADVAGVMLGMLGELDDAIDERTKTIARGKLTLACKQGCNACCASPLLVSEGEAVAVAEWLALPENAAIRAKFVAAFPAWKRAVGDLGVTLGKARTRDEMRDAAIAFTRKEIMCAFNRDGSCTIYAARPARCRTTHALDSDANCGNKGNGQVTVYEHARTQIAFEEQESLRNAVHHTLRPDADFELLCSAVDRLLGAGTTIGRNDPCPCGSGLKYKRCCG